MKNVYFLETVLAFLCLKFWEVKYSFTLYPYENQILELFLRRIKFSFSTKSLNCTWPAAWWLPYTPSRFDICLRIVFVLIWIKWLIEKCSCTAFIAFPEYRKTCLYWLLSKFYFAFLFSPALPLPIERE